MILFGTGGIRGIMREGEFDEKTVAVASKGVAEYMKMKGLKKVLIAYDTRNNSQEFAKVSASVFAGEGMDVYVFGEPVPTPVLSYGVRKLGMDMGVVITASHNPPEYNGYKVYTSNGVQAVPEVTDVLTEMVKRAWNQPINAVEEYKIVPNEVLDEYISDVAKLVNVDLKGLKVVYSPLHGTGARFVPKLLRMLGAEVVEVVEQMEHNGNFPTVKTPNPEDDRALELLKKYMADYNVDLGLATDPDADRVGVVFKDVRLTGNQVGVLLSKMLIDEYLSSGRNKGMLVKTIVTTDMVRPMCDESGIKLFEVPTGFKFIGDLVEKGKDLDFVFGFEESCGYLTGDLARDKDAVLACGLVAKAAVRFDLLNKMEELYKQYGYYFEKLVNFDFKSVEQALDVYAKLKQTKAEEVKQVIDYSEGYNGVIPNETLRLDFDNARIYVRPSGTEPKMKAYVMVKAQTKEQALADLEKFEAKIRSIVDGILAK
ncbi:phosphomannomutase [Fervidobacterium changbaicum]|uniref:Phospho-sugar mutase n=1 Tax=Fervidobacterium changbaicum TaxID=310769 RepID=A0AAE5XD35_9BACT|nr:phospho-sugar mutase [Fervidobacterium changbaicum]QAV33904.1 phospho-sugar mutase [Fervidobacterium changbaicum]SDH72955.1 phosphomannomutase [Fervidobacterium changbaicum]